MEAVFKVKPSEFEAAILRIKEFLFRGNSDAIEITISLRDNSESGVYLEELKKSIAEADSDTECVTFSPDEFRAFVNQNLAR